jgi:LacI family transcriptional regulator
MTGVRTVTSATSRGPTIYDVARVAGVSLTTVSRVINGHVSVSHDVRTRVQQAISGLGYERDTVALNMRRGVTKTVAVAIRDFNMPPTATSIKAIEATLREAGYTVLLADTNEEKTIELALIREFSQRRVDGVLMTLSDEDDPELVATVMAAKMPIVLLHRSRVDSVDCVMPDLRGGTRQATEHLLSLGHRRIALLTGKPCVFPARARIDGFLEAYSAAGLQPEIELIRTRAFTSEFAFSETSRLLGMENRPTGLILGGMAMLPGALRAMRMSGVAAGSDLSVIAGCDSDLAELATPTITAVTWDATEFGRFAAQFLIDRMQGPRDTPPVSLVLPTTLILRRSCQAPAKVPIVGG